MALSTAIAIYFLIWWVVLFAVLPWGVRPQGDESEPGTDPGAPRIPQIKVKLIWTTIVSAVVFAALVAVYTYEIITIDDLAALIGVPW